MGATILEYHCHTEHGIDSCIRRRWHPSSSHCNRLDTHSVSSVFLRQEMIFENHVMSRSM